MSLLVYHLGHLAELGGEFAVLDQSRHFKLLACRSLMVKRRKSNLGGFCQTPPKRCLHDAKTQLNKVPVYISIVTGVEGFRFMVYGSGFRVPGLNRGCRARGQ
jgi:hypothetical protein